MRRVSADHGRAAAVLLEPDRLPFFAEDVVAFAVTGDELLLARKTDASALEKAARKASESPVNWQGVQCIAPGPLEWVGQRWKPWSVPSALAATVGFKAFAATVRRCEVAQSLGMVRQWASAWTERTGKPAAFEPPRAPRSRVDLSSGQRLRPQVVAADADVDVVLPDETEVTVPWSRFSVAARNRLTPLILASADVPGFWVVRTPLDEAGLKALRAK